jgi:hypothetical protein
MLKSKSLPGKFWGKAMNTAVYLLNRALKKSVVGMTPYEAWCGCKPTVDHLRTFGCVAHVQTMADHVSKLVDRSTPMVMIGYETGSKAYRVYNPAMKKVQVTRDVIFEEEKAWAWGDTNELEALPLNDIFHILYDDEGDGDDPEPSGTQLHRGYRKSQRGTHLPRQRTGAKTLPRQNLLPSWQRMEKTLPQ